MSMKSLIIVVITILFCNGLMFCQTEEDIDEIKTTLDAIKDRVNSDEETDDVVGEIYYFENVSAYDQSGNSTQITITEVELYIQDGLIKSIRCKDSNDNIYFDQNLHLFLGYLESPDTRKHKGIFNSLDHKTPVKKLYEINSEKQIYIYAQDVVRYHPKIGNKYIPDETTVILNSENKIQSVTKNVDLNSHVKFNLYTDLLGLLSNQPNGLLQAELSSYITLFRRPYLSNLFIINHIRPTVTYRRFDKAIESFDVSNYGNLDEFKDDLFFNLYQRSFLDVRFDVNIFKLSGLYAKFEADAGVGYSLTKIILPNAFNEKIGLLNYYQKLNFQVLRYNNFGLDITGNLIFSNYLNDLDISPENDLIKMYDVGSTIFYNPLNNKSNRIYLRMNLLNTLTKVDNVEPFFRLELGYKAILKFNNDKVKN